MLCGNSRSPLPLRQNPSSKHPPRAPSGTWAASQCWTARQWATLFPPSPGNSTGPTEFPSSFPVRHVSAKVVPIDSLYCLAQKLSKSPHIRSSVKISYGRLGRYFYVYSVEPLFFGTAFPSQSLDGCDFRNVLEWNSHCLPPTTFTLIIPCYLLYPLPVHRSFLHRAATHTRRYCSRHSNLHQKPRAME